MNTLAISSNGVIEPKTRFERNTPVAQPRYPAFVEHTSIHISSVMLKKSLLDEVGLFNKSLRIHEDSELWNRIGEKYAFGYIEQPLVVYRWKADPEHLMNDRITRGGANEKIQTSIDLGQLKILIDISNEEDYFAIVEKLHNALLTLQSECEPTKDRKTYVITAARGIIACLEKMPPVHRNKEDRSSGFEYAKQIKRKLMKKHGGCLACGGGTMGGRSRHDAPIELHHMIPRSYGGNDEVTNALLVCRSCHGEIHA
ncbi:MAG: HNH endonuclease [Candidatus Kerfeldbacteria bacterium]|nr:HNH endonuclease [Candidatus Kerfeldbacteria bacterium]